MGHYVNRELYNQNVNRKHFGSKKKYFIKYFRHYFKNVLWVDRKSKKKRFGINTPHILWAEQSNYDFMVILIKCAYQMSTYT